MRVLELFGGIGACTTALRRIGVDVEVADYVEIDKYAVASYNAINGTNFEPQDICTWDKNIEVDLIMHGSPCQDFSVAGKQAGGDVGSGTRSSLMYETIRIVGKLRPKYVVWENVKNLLSAKHRHNFDAYLDTMKALGYTNYYQVLNAKDHGIPQNRERVFTISVLGTHDSFMFPSKQPLELRLKDLLEDDVDEKYYVSSQLELKNNNSISGCVQIGMLNIKGMDCVRRVYSDEGLSPTLTNMQGGNRQPKIIKYDIPQTVTVRKYEVDNAKLVEALRKGKRSTGLTNRQLAEKLEIPITKVEHWFRQDSSFAIPDSELWFKLKELLQIETDEFDESIMTFEEREGVFEKSNRCYHEQGISPTITSASADEKVITDYHIRKLTPKECWRLMGFDDEDFEKASKVNSNSQLYKQAGNSIVVNVLEAIFKNLF